MPQETVSSPLREKFDIIPDFDSQNYPVYPFVVHETECSRGYAFSAHSEFTFWSVELMLSGCCHYTIATLGFRLGTGDGPHRASETGYLV